MGTPNVSTPSGPDPAARLLSESPVPTDVRAVELR